MPSRWTCWRTSQLDDMCEKLDGKIDVLVITAGTN